MRSPSSSFRLPLLAAGALLAGCSSGGGGGSVDSALTVAITDAASDELASFVVEIASLEGSQPSAFSSSMIGGSTRSWKDSVKS